MTIWTDSDREQIKTGVERCSLCCCVRTVQTLLILYEMNKFSEEAQLRYRTISPSLPSSHNGKSEDSLTMTAEYSRVLDKARLR